MAERAFLGRENDGGENGVKLDPRTETVRLQKMFDTARADQQANYPDLYVSTAGVTAKDSKDQSKQLEDVKAEAAKVQSELAAKVDMLMGKLDGKVEARVGDAIQSVAKA